MTTAPKPDLPNPLKPEPPYVTVTRLGRLSWEATLHHDWCARRRHAFTQAGAERLGASMLARHMRDRAWKAETYRLAKS